MNGTQLKELRARKGWSQSDVANLINGALGRKMNRGEIGKFENGKRPIPKATSEFLDRIALEQDFPLPEERLLEGDHEPPFEPGDTPPPKPPGVEDAVGSVAAVVGGGSYSRVCEELWELVATGVGMVGAVTGSEKLQADGKIILADKANLGKAYGKLAEQNATFRNMLVGMSGGGAWLEVALVSGITAGKVMRNHQRQPETVEPQPEQPQEGNGYGDGAVVNFPG